MEITYRRATVADVEALVALRAAFLVEFHQKDMSDLALLDAIRNCFARTLPTAEFVAFVAEVNGKVIGLGGMIYDTHLPMPNNLTGRQPYIMNMYTVPEYRRRGIAATILDKLLEHAKADGCRRVTLHTAPIARALYAKAGFVAVETEMRIEFGDT